MTHMGNAKPDDIYRDPEGRLWRVTGVCREPTVYLERVEGPEAGVPIPIKIDMARHEQRAGGVSGLMWNGWVRLVPEGGQE